MPQRIANAELSSPVNSLDHVRLKPAKATLPVNADQCRMTAIVKDGLMKACGSLKAAAIQMDMDAGQLTRELENGAFKFERLERLTPDEKAVVVQRLHEEFGTLNNPWQQAERLFREITERMDALKHLVSYFGERVA